MDWKKERPLIEAQLERLDDLIGNLLDKLEGLWVDLHDLPRVKSTADTRVRLLNEIQETERKIPMAQNALKNLNAKIYTLYRLFLLTYVPGGESLPNWNNRKTRETILRGALAYNFEFSLRPKIYEPTPPLAQGTLYNLAILRKHENFRRQQAAQETDIERYRDNQDPWDYLELKLFKKDYNEPQPPNYDQFLQCIQQVCIPAFIQRAKYITPEGNVEFGEKEYDRFMLFCEKVFHFYHDYQPTYEQELREFLKGVGLSDAFHPYTPFRSRPGDFLIRLPFNREPLTNIFSDSPSLQTPEFLQPYAPTKEFQKRAPKMLHPYLARETNLLLSAPLNLEHTTFFNSSIWTEIKAARSRWVLNEDEEEEEEIEMANLEREVRGKIEEEAEESSSEGEGEGESENGEGGEEEGGEGDEEIERVGVTEEERKEQVLNYESDPEFLGSPKSLLSEPDAAEGEMMEAFNKLKKQKTT